MLDHCIWNALSSCHVSFAEGDEFAKRYPPAVTALAAMRDFSAESFASLARLLSPEEMAIFFLNALPTLPAGWRVLREVPLMQMVWNGTVVTDDEGIERLSIADVDEMLALTELTKPGPFGKRTHELGTYLGIKNKGRLVAMAGERLRLPGFTEVSAVCTHPDFQGRGLGTLLFRFVAGEISARGDTVFLHAYYTNTSAITLYKTLGFKLRSEMNLRVVKRGV